ncbi:tail fiber assembly protein [Collimonas sp. NPDC087041]|uniref:tail fiber assembly protein n=1 Tax=Collimonas sp. NPDC087041 TaxID=3363960 RepID=UPI00381CCE5D
MPIAPDLTLPELLDPTPIPPAPPLAQPPVLAPNEEIPPVDPFAYTDIKGIVRLPGGFQCSVKFTAHDDYLSFFACPDDVEAHGRAIHAACAARQAPDYFPNDAEYLATAQERIELALRRANSEVVIFQDRVDVDEASDADRAQLTAWKKYRVAINRIPEQSGYPHAITWPAVPNA